MNVVEIIIAQVFTQFFILIIQMTLLIVVLIFGFKVLGKSPLLSVEWSPPLISLPVLVM